MINNKLYNSIINSISHSIKLSLNEMARAKVNRTIDRKLWLSVASLCSRNKSTEAEYVRASSKMSKDEALNKYVASLLIMKKPCPKSIEDIDELKTFKFIGHLAIKLGCTIEDIQNLYDLNNSSAKPVTLESPKPHKRQSSLFNDDIFNDNDIEQNVNLQDKVDLKSPKLVAKQLPSTLKLISQGKEEKYLLEYKVHGYCHNVLAEYTGYVSFEFTGFLLNTSFTGGVYFLIGDKIIATKSDIKVGFNVIEFCKLYVCGNIYDCDNVNIIYKMIKNDYLETQNYDKNYYKNRIKETNILTVLKLAEQPKMDTTVDKKIRYKQLCYDLFDFIEKNYNRDLCIDNDIIYHPDDTEYQGHKLKGKGVLYMSEVNEYSDEAHWYNPNYKEDYTPTFYYRKDTRLPNYIQSVFNWCDKHKLTVSNIVLVPEYV